MRKLIMPQMLVLALLAFSATASAQVGQIQNASGHATTERGGKLLNSVPGMGIQLGDTLSTGELSSTVLKLRDGAVFRMKSGTILRISEFTYQPGGGANGFGVVVIDLLQGGISVISGAIGSVDPANFVINTPSGTINAMQGEFSVFVLTESLPGNVQVDGADIGTYINVAGGIVLFSNDSGTHLLESGDIVFIPNSSSPPGPAGSLPPGVDIDIDIEIEIGDPDAGFPDPDQPIGSPTATPPGASISPTPTPSATVSPAPTASPTASPSASPTASATPSASPTPTASASPVPTPTATATPTASPTPTPSTTPSPTPTAEPTPTPSDPPDPSPSPDPPVSPA